MLDLNCKIQVTSSNGGNVEKGVCIGGVVRNDDDDNKASKKKNNKLKRKIHSKFISRDFGSANQSRPFSNTCDT